VVAEGQPAAGEVGGEPEGGREEGGDDDGAARGAAPHDDDGGHQDPPHDEGGSGLAILPSRPMPQPTAGGRGVWGRATRFDVPAWIEALWAVAERAPNYRRCHPRHENWTLSALAEEPIGYQQKTPEKKFEFLITC